MLVHTLLSTLLDYGIIRRPIADILKKKKTKPKFLQHSLEHSFTKATSTSSKINFFFFEFSNTVHLYIYTKKIKFKQLL